MAYLKRKIELMDDDEFSEDDHEIIMPESKEIEEKIDLSI